MIKHKSDVFNIFSIFKSLVENQLNTKIKTFYSDNGGDTTRKKLFRNQFLATK